MKKRARSRPSSPFEGRLPPASSPPRGTARLLSVEELRWRCDPRPLRAAVRAAEGDEELPAGRRAPRLPVSVDELVGQERALAAIRTGLLQDGPGFNIFVSGLPGTGREALVRAALREAFDPASDRFEWAGFPPPRDRLYVADFDRPDRPRLVTLARGRGKKFKREVDDLILVLRNALVTAFEDEDFRDRREHRKRQTDRHARRLFTEFADRVHDEDFTVGEVGDGFATPEVMLELRTAPAAGSDAEPPGRRWLTRKQIERRIARGDIEKSRTLSRKLARMTQVERELEDVAAHAREVARRGAAALKRLDERTARLAALGPVRDLATRYPTEAVRVWTDQLIERIGERLHVFLERHPDDPEPDDRDPPDNERRDRPQGDSFAEYRANLVVDASARPAPPVIFEEVPTYSNLMGTLEAGDPQGPEHLRIRAGSLLAADGGVLVLDARELLQDSAAWRALKKALLRGRVEVQRFEPQSHQPAGPVRPSGVKIALKVVLVGDDESYHQLHDHDDDFRSVFKVKVEVDDTVPNTEGSRLALASTVARLARRAGLVAPDTTALARLLEHAARLAGRRDRLEVRLGELLDVLREAEEHARRMRGKRIKAEHVHAALIARRARHDLSERKTQELLDEGVVLMDTSGARTGQVNALAVYDTGDHVFARPSRVTASVSVGRAGVIDIEREAHLSGDTHHKGIQIMAGFLRSRWSQDSPLCLTASVCFEQSYSPIDGDSASVAEVVAILSALAGAPLDQSWAVTGSLNQMGDVQAIGDVNEKVEGFFDACHARGLTGAQGVLVPASNLGDLMLRDDVLEAVAAGRFHVRATRTIDDVLETLARASLTPEAIHERVSQKLAALADAWRRYERSAPG